MLSAHDVPMYLVAVKSLLRFYPSLAIVVHSDGTLRARDEELVRHHVPECKVVDVKAADERARRHLGESSFLWNVRNFDAAYRRLVDTELWNDSCKRIIMDSDVIVLKNPVELISWIEDGATPFLMGQPPKPPTNGVVRSTHVQPIFKARVDEIAAVIGRPAAFLDGGTGGFYGCSRELALDRVEPLLRACIDLDIPIRIWGGDQCAIIYMLSSCGAIRLDSERYMNFGPDCVDKVEGATLLHFYGTYRFLGNVYPDLSNRVITELLQGHHAVAN
jgi:hypothetical protein